MSFVRLCSPARPRQQATLRIWDAERLFLHCPISVLMAASSCTLFIRYFSISRLRHHRHHPLRPVGSACYGSDPRAIGGDPASSGHKEAAVSRVFNLDIDRLACDHPRGADDCPSGIGAPATHSWVSTSSCSSLGAGICLVSATSFCQPL